MANSIRASDSFDLDDREHDPESQMRPAAIENESTIGRQSLSTILAFLSREIDQSAAILRNLAEHLSDELCALGTEADTEAVRLRLAASTMALQNEDRLQQRLGDMRTALIVLEQALSLDEPLAEADINLDIIRQLHLEEMRYAFALSVDLLDMLPQSSKPAKTPSLGEVDLF